MISSQRGRASPQRGRTYERESYTSEEVRALLDRTSSRAPSAVRNRALITLLWQSGLRVSEALDLRPDDFDLSSMEVFVRRGKGGKARRVRTGPDAVIAVSYWLQVRARLNLPPNAPLFCTLRGTRLYTSYVRATIQRLARGAGWTKRAHPHGFRHTFAVNLARSGVPVVVIQRQLGHETLATTSIYLTSITASDIAEAMDRVTW